MRMITVAVADDHPFTCLGVEEALNREGDMQVVGMATNSAQVMPLIRETLPDVLILDIEGMKAIGVLKALQAQVPTPRVLILSTHCEPWRVKQMLDAGASSYLSKTASPSWLAVAVRATAEGATFLGPEVSKPIEASGHLTERELDVVRCLAQGLTTDQQIADELHVEASTVKNHLNHIYRKTDASSRIELLLWALDNGLAGERYVIFKP